MKVFITGATGFIGRCLIDKLLKDNCEITALVRNNNHKLPANVNIIIGDILNSESFKNASYPYDVLYHLAGFVTFNQDQKRNLIEVNYIGTLNILSFALSCSVKQTVIISSACTIGISLNRNTLLDENCSLSSGIIKSNPYLESKLYAETAAMEFSKSLNVVIVNPSTVYGPGDYSLNSGTLLSNFLKSSILPVPPGGCNAIDVDDVSEGIIAAGKYGLSGHRYIISNENLTFLDIFNMFSIITNHKPIFIHIPAFMKTIASSFTYILGLFLKNRFFTPQIVNDLFLFKYYSNKKAINELKWKPTFNFKNTTTRAIEFYNNNNLI